MPRTNKMHIGECDNCGGHTLYARCPKCSYDLFEIALAEQRNAAIEYKRNVGGPDAASDGGGLEGIPRWPTPEIVAQRDPYRGAQSGFMKWFR